MSVKLRLMNISTLPLGARPLRHFICPTLTPDSVPSWLKEQAVGTLTVVPQPSHGTTTKTTTESWDPTKCHPISNLPVEILSRVLLFSFSLCDFVQMPTSHAVAHVCVLWRAIITETPDFWTTISNISTESEIRVKLSKSSNAGIDIFYCECKRLAARMKAYPFLKLVAPHIERWSSICTEGPALKFQEALRSFPNVQSTHLPCWTMKRQVSSFTNRVSLKDLPSNIVDIRLEGLTPTCNSSTNYSLVSLELCGSLGQDHDLLFTTLTWTLTACPNIKVLRLGPLSPRQSGTRLILSAASRDRVSVPAPCLQHPELRGAHSALFSRLLKNLVMPNLSKLFLHSTNWVAASLGSDAGGRSLLQATLDNAGCSSLTVSVGRATTLEWIKIHGETGGSRLLEVELLKKASGVLGNVYGLNTVTIPVQLRVVGSPSGFLFPLLQKTPTASHLWYRPHLDSGWKTLALTAGDLNNLPSQWEHTLGSATSPVSAFIKDCYVWYSVEMRYGDPLRERRLRALEYDFDTTKPGH
ncbi:hypothetical protein M407DRAFT_29112 [Tulasnella calospora MUT 4182]|uniref:Uncharacterized protein n=1 Tax=Tulasnella calospora MUT 4182 TaxID=1051891 RepID=A0A0C3Q9K3_9AGAM|nr:hypothetical protein M407DRAFT_29112 [Tulasnella calospora MUT 4182]